MAFNISFSFSLRPPADVTTLKPTIVRVREFRIRMYVAVERYSEERRPPVGYPFSNSRGRIEGRRRRKIREATRERAERYSAFIRLLEFHGDPAPDVTIETVLLEELSLQIHPGTFSVRAGHAESAQPASYISPPRSSSSSRTSVWPFFFVLLCFSFIFFSFSSTRTVTFPQCGEIAIQRRSFISGFRVTLVELAVSRPRRE